MLQVPQHIWNAVAKAGALQTPLMRKLCAMTDEEINQFHDQEWTRLKTQGYSSRAVGIMQTLRPSLLEPEAVLWMIDHFPGIEQAQPVVNSLSEAMQIGRAEHNHQLSPMEETQTILLLKKLLEERRKVQVP